jgi:hypothetical protein
MGITLKHGMTLALLAVISIFAFVKPAHAVPAFARQMGTTCSACHFQNFPALNSFGRLFRANGYTMQGAQTMIQGDNLSLPSTINASVITKIRYQKKKESDRGEIQWPDEAAILVGGRASEKIGFLMELGLGPVGADVSTGSNVVTGDTNGDGIKDPGENWVLEGETHGTFLSTKVHFNVTDNFAIIPFSTDGLGVAYGYEMLNTGVQRSQRPIENRKGFSAGQALGTSSGEATGLAFIYKTPDFFINYSHWAPTWGNVNADIFGGLANYIRAAYIPNIGGWDTGFGINSMSGSVKSGENDPADETFVDSWGIDAQAQGVVGDMTLGIYASYGEAPKSSASEENLYNSSTTDDASALGLVTKLGINAKTSVYLAYSSLDKDGSKESSNTVGVQYQPAQNVKLEAFTVSEFDSANDYTMLMLFAGF